MPPGRRVRAGIVLAIVCAATYQGHGHTWVSGNPDAAHEKIIRTYFGGWEKKDWSIVANQLAEGFTFTSPAPDDHISAEQFKAKCWNQAEHIQRFEFVKIVGNESEAFALMHVITTDGRVIRNTEFFTFDHGKIRAIEVFFGGTGQGFPTNQ